MPELDDFGARWGLTGTIQDYKGRGVYVPAGMTVAEIMEGAAVLEDRYEVPHYTARNMVIAVLSALRDKGAKGA